jgi:hypothetical protein
MLFIMMHNFDVFLLRINYMILVPTNIIHFDFGL